MLRSGWDRLVLGALALIASATPELYSQQGPVISADLAPVDFLGRRVSEEPLEPFQPQLKRDERGDDWLHASALVTQARLFFRREQYAEALASYQRAYRYSESPVLLTSIVSLAFRLGRNDEAAAYAQLAHGKADIDSVVLNRLSLDLTVRQDYHQALLLYRMATGAMDDVPHGANIVTLFETGRLLYLTDQYQESARAFQRVRKALETPNPDPADQPAIKALLQGADITYALMAEAALRVGEADEAEHLFRRAYEKETDAPLLRFHRARVAFLRKEWEEAERLLRDYLQSGLTDAGIEPFELLSKVLEFQNRSEQLLPYLETLASTQRTNLFLAYFYGQTLLHNQQYERAIRVLNELQSQRPLTDTEQLRLEVYAVQQDPVGCLETLTHAVQVWGDLDLLQPQFSKLIQDENLCRQILVQSTPEQVRAAVLATDAARTESAKTESASAEQNASDAARSSDGRSARLAQAFALAQLCERMDQMELAADYYDVAIGRGGQVYADAGLAWGLSQLMREDMAGARATFLRVLEGTLEESERGLMEYHLSAACTAQREFDEALHYAQSAARRLPDAAMVQSRPAWILYLAQRHPEAYTAYVEFLERWNPRYGDGGVRGVVKEAKFSLSNICLALGKQEEAEEWLEEVLDEFPGDVGALNDLAYLWADRGVHLHRAWRMASQACRIDPENLAYRDTLGWALYRLGRYTEAVEQLKIACGDERPDGILLEHLADALLQAEGPAAARPVWQRALEHLDATEAVRRKEIEEKLAKTNVE